MSQSDDSSEKTHEPTQKKLDDARKKGEIARSTDVNIALTYFGAWLFLLAAGATQISNLGNVLQETLAAAFVVDRELRFGAGATLLGGVFQRVGEPLALFAFVPASLIILTLLAQRALVFTPSKIKPKLSRLSIIKNAKNKFGRSGLFEFAKSFVKLMIYSISLAAFLYANFDLIVGSSAASARSSIVTIFTLIGGFLGIVVLVSASLAVIDYLWQYNEHLRKNRMSHKEMRDEIKDAEGDPHLKQARRSRAQEVALNQMMAEIPLADVVIVNPTHYAVALKWSGDKTSAPVCVAKGVDEIAMRIREKAGDANVPLHSDPPTARALHATVEIGEEIRPEHYAAVAVAIRFADTLRKSLRL